eukprot:4633930-Pyramimonas_sp.AAC.1
MRPPAYYICICDVYVMLACIQKPVHCPNPLVVVFLLLRLFHRPSSASASPPSHQVRDSQGDDVPKKGARMGGASMLTGLPSANLCHRARSFALLGYFS